MVKRGENLHVDRARTRGDNGISSHSLVGLKHPTVENAQNESEDQLYASVIKNMQIGLYIWHLEDTSDPKSFRLVAANPATQRFSRVPTKEILGKKLGEAFPESDEMELVKAGMETIRSGKSMELTELRYSDKRVPESFFSVKAFSLPKNCVGVILEDVTERKRAEQEMQENEEKFQAISASVLDAIILMDSEGRISYWNPAAERIFGYTKDEATGQKLHEIIIPKRLRGNILRRLRKLEETGQDPHAVKREFIAARKDGTEFPIELSTSKLKIKGKWHTLGIIRDVTEQKQMEHTMRQSEEKYRNASQKLASLMRSSATMLHTTDLRERLKTIAEAVREQDWGRVVISLRDENLNTIDVVTAGLTPDEEQYLRDHQSSGQVWRKRLSSMFERFRLGEFYYLPWSDPLVRKQFKYALRSKVLKKETVDWDPDDLLFVPLRLPNGQVVGIMSMDDPKDGRRPTRESLAPLELFAQQAAVAIENAKLIQQVKEYAQHLEEKVEERTRDLRKSEEKLRSIFAASPDAITATDLNGNVVECNEQTLKMHEYASKQELIGQSSFKLIAKKDHEKVAEDMKRVLNEGLTKNAEYTFVTKTGREFPAELSASIVLDASRNPLGFVAITKDITERKRMEQQLFKSERLAAIGELAGMVGHDLRNPLTGIAGAAYYLKTKCTSRMDDKAREMLEIIGNDIEYSNKIINDLLEYSREIRLEQTETTPKAITNEALALVRIPKNIQVIDLTTDTPRIEADVGKLKRAFVNIIKNAVDAMPKGGKLTLKSKRSKTNVEFTFTDTGVGIPKEVAGKIFTPLFTTKAKGMGFGLPICKRNIEAHGGHITVQSKVGRGTTFTVTMPIEGKPTENERIWINMPESWLTSNAFKKYRS